MPSRPLARLAAPRRLLRACALKAASVPRDMTASARSDFRAQPRRSQAVRQRRCAALARLTEGRKAHGSATAALRGGRSAGKRSLIVGAGRGLACSRRRHAASAPHDVHSATPDQPTKICSLRCGCARDRHVKSDLLLPSTSTSLPDVRFSLCRGSKHGVDRPLGCARKPAGGARDGAPARFAAGTTRIELKSCRAALISKQLPAGSGEAGRALEQCGVALGVGPFFARHAVAVAGTPPVSAPRRTLTCRSPPCLASTRRQA
jgi:hypothetical protein